MTTPCDTCRHYHGHSYGHDTLHCAMYPYGPGGDACEDWEARESAPLTDEDYAWADGVIERLAVSGERHIPSRPWLSEAGFTVEDLRQALEAMGQSGVSVEEVNEGIRRIAHRIPESATSKPRPWWRRWLG